MIYDNKKVKFTEITSVKSGEMTDSAAIEELKNMSKEERVDLANQSQEVNNQFNDIDLLNSLKNIIDNINKINTVENNN